MCAPEAFSSRGTVRVFSLTRRLISSTARRCGGGVGRTCTTRLRRCGVTLGSGSVLHVFRPSRTATRRLSLSLQCRCGSPVATVLFPNVFPCFPLPLPPPVCVTAVVPRLSLCTRAALPLLLFCSVSLRRYVFGLPFLPSFGRRGTVPLSCTDVAMPGPPRLPPISSLLSSFTNSSPPRHPMTRPSLPPVWDYPPLPPLPPLESLPQSTKPTTATEAASLPPVFRPAPERDTPRTATFTLPPINIDSGLDFDGVGSTAVRTDIPLNGVPSGGATVFLSTPPQVLPVTTVRMHAVISAIRLNLRFIEHAQHLSRRPHWTTTTHPRRTTVGSQSGREHVSGSGATAAARWPPLLMQMVTVPSVASGLTPDSRAASRQGLVVDPALKANGV